MCSSDLHPARFFAQLRALGIRCAEHPFPDHHPFRAAELAFADAQPVLMTEKDAVKCRAFALPGWCYLQVQAEPSAAFVTWFDSQLDRLLPVHP